jgi:hypothetical protein
MRNGQDRRHFAHRAFFVTSGRILRKIRHKLIEIIVMSLCVVLAGADDGVESADYARIK